MYRFYYDAGYYDAPVRGAFDTQASHVFEIADRQLLDELTIAEEAAIKSGTKEMYQWIKAHAVCYEIVYPKGLTWKEKMALVKQDLDRYFALPLGFGAQVESRTDSNTMALRVVDTNKVRAIRNSSTNTTNNTKAAEQHDRYSYEQHHLPLNHFISLLNDYYYQNKKLVFVDKTNLSQPISLKLSCDMTNIAQINAALDLYGLQLTKQTSTINVLVFKQVRR